jgi:hypothetical protein
MNRCITQTSLPTLRRRTAGALALAALASALCAPAFAQFAPRPFPPAAVRGAMVITNPPELVMNGRPERLSPGARIRNANNMLVLSGALVGQNLLVNFVREPNGMVHEVWILTPDEARQVLPTGGITLVK